MPELPEVENVRQQLSHYLPFKIVSVSTTPQLKQNILHTKLNLINKSIIDIRRKGKILDFILNDGSHLLSHFGMTGTWLVGETVDKGKHTHLILTGKKHTLAYDDPRRFGHMYYYNKEQADEKLAELGMDLADKNFNLKYLSETLKRFPEKPLKVALMNQKYFAGSGNYIANEICARASILPTRKCKLIKKEEFSKILSAVKKILRPGLEMLVYQQKICQRCKKTPVKKIVLAQRGTFYCPYCQY